MRRLGETQRRLAVACERRIMPFFGESRAQQVGHAQIVLGNQNLHVIYRSPPLDEIDK